MVEPHSNSQPAGLDGRADPHSHSSGSAAARDQVAGAPVRMWRPVLFLAVGAAALAGLFALGLVPRLRAKAEVATAPDGPQSVNIVVVASAPSESEIELPGTSRADEETSILARTNGYLKRWLVDLGDEVAADQLMAEIATPEVDQELAQARATLEQARASLSQMKAALARAKADHDVAKTSYDRAKKSSESGVIGQQEYDNAEGTFKTTEAMVLSATANIGGAEANIKAASANVRRLEELQSFQQIRAPFAGCVTARNVDTGSLISVGQPSGTASLSSPSGARELFKVARTDPVRVYVNVPQAFTPWVKVGSPAQIQVREYPGRPFGCKVSRTANALDPLTRTLATEVRVPNPDHALLPGMYVQVKFVQKREKPPVIVPGGSLVTRTDGTLVAVVGDGDKVEYRRVVVGRDFGGKVEVISGLSVGERVAVNLVEEIPDGTIVRPVPMPLEPAPSK